MKEKFHISCIESVIISGETYDLSKMSEQEKTNFFLECKNNNKTFSLIINELKYIEFLLEQDKNKD